MVYVMTIGRTRWVSKGSLRPPYLTSAREPPQDSIMTSTAFRIAKELVCALANATISQTQAMPELALVGSGPECWDFGNIARLGNRLSKTAGAPPRLVSN